MIQLPHSALEVISQQIAPANSASLIWRKLSESPTVQYLASDVSQDELMAALQGILRQEVLNEFDQATAYCIEVALLLQNRRLTEAISSLEGVDKAFWLKPISRYASENISATNEETLAQKPQLFTDHQSSSSESTSRIILVGRES
jgi:hypothetical protein